jgi:UDP-GlcNAc:undecaprenyl-phosphate GlcNAc-1-phosphate transferase
VKSAFEALIIALLVVAALTPLVRMLAFRLDAVAHPGGRHIHKATIPRLGGLAICIGLFAPLVILGLTEPAVADMFRPIWLRVLGLVLGGAIMCVVGVIDDTRGIRAGRKLLAQIAVAIFAFACGLRIEAIHLPLIGDFATWSLALPLTVLWIVGVMNAVNLIDGLDGLAAGVVFFAAATNFVVAWLSGTLLVALLAAAVAGAVLGFLIYNFNPARIFMGDSGSYLLGYVLATTALVGTPQKASTAVSLLVPVMALGVPIFDTLFAMVRRILERRPVFSPDRGHIHHRLLDMGLTHRRAVVVLYAVCGVFTAAAIGVSLERTWQVGAALLGASLALIGLVRFVGYFEYLHLDLRQKARIRSRDAERLRFTLPLLPKRLEAAASEREVIEELERFAKDAELGVVEIFRAVEAGKHLVHRWSVRPSSDTSATRDMVFATYPLGSDASARGSLRFGWHSDFGDVSPQSEILLQVATDQVAEHLARLRSTLAPTEARAAEPERTIAVPREAPEGRL